MADIIGVGLSIDPSGAIEGANKAVVAMEAANAAMDSLSASAAVVGENLRVGFTAPQESLDTLAAATKQVNEELRSFGIDPGEITLGDDITVWVDQTFRPALSDAEAALDDFARAAVAASELSIDPKLNLDEFQRAEAVAADAVEDMRAVLENSGLKLGPVSVEALEEAVASVMELEAAIAAVDTSGLSFEGIDTSAVDAAQGAVAGLGGSVLKFEDLVGDAFQTMSAEVRATTSEFTNLEGRIFDMAADARRILLETGTPFDAFTVAMDDAAKAAFDFGLELSEGKLSSREFGREIDNVRSTLIASATTLRSYGDDYDVVGSQADRFIKIIQGLGKPTSALDILRDDINQLNADMVVGEVGGDAFADSMAAIHEQLLGMHGTLKDGEFGKFSQLMRLTSPEVVKVGKATANAAKGMKSMSSALLFMASSSLAGRTGVGRLANSLLRFGGGNPWLIGIVAGVAAIALAWSLLGKKAKKAKEETDSLIESMLKAANIKINPAFEGLEDVNALVIRMAEETKKLREEEERRLNIAASIGGGVGGPEGLSQLFVPDTRVEDQQKAVDKLKKAYDEARSKANELFRKAEDDSALGQLRQLVEETEKAARQLNMTAQERALDDLARDQARERMLVRTAGLGEAPGSPEELARQLEVALALQATAEATKKAKEQNIANAEAVRDMIAAEERLIETLDFTRGELFAYELALLGADENLQDLWRTTIDARDAKDRLDAFFEADEIGKAAAVWAGAGDEIVNALLDEKAALTLTNRELLERRLVLEVVGASQQAYILGLHDEVEALRAAAFAAEQLVEEEKRLAEEADIFGIAFNRAVENAQDAMASFFNSIILGTESAIDILVRLLETISQIASQAAAAGIFKLGANALSSGLGSGVSVGGGTEIGIPEGDFGGGGGGPGIDITPDIPPFLPVTAPAEAFQQASLDAIQALPVPSALPVPVEFDLPDLEAMLPAAGVLQPEPSASAPPPTPAPPEQGISTVAEAGVRTVVHQTIQFNVSALDQRGVRQVLEENKGQIVTMVAEQARKSSSFRHALFGG